MSLDAPVRVTLSRAKGWRMPANAVKLCRPGIWGNPFAVSGDMSDAEAVALHKAWIGSGDWASWMWCHHRNVLLALKADPSDHFRLLLETLRGKNLACWCAQGSPCHADTLLVLANEVRPPESQTLNTTP